jgi:hypothetical protein
MMRRVAGSARGIATAVLAALFVALAGTGPAQADPGVERRRGFAWGVAAALLLLASVQLWLAAWSRSVVPAAVAGVVTYAVVGVLSSAGPAKQLVLGDAVGNVWVFGIGGVTLIMLDVIKRWLSVGRGPSGLSSRRRRRNLFRRDDHCQRNLDVGSTRTYGATYRWFSADSPRRPSSRPRSGSGPPPGCPVLRREGIVGAANSGESPFHTKTRARLALAHCWIIGSEVECPA